MTNFLDLFLKEGWTYFYKVCLSLFKTLELEIMGAADRDDFMVMSEIMSILKLQPPLEDSAYRSPREESKDPSVIKASRRERRVSDDDAMSVEVESRMKVQNSP